MIITITGRIPSKKNSKRFIKRGARKFLVPSENHEAWHEGASYELIKHRNGHKFIEKSGIKLSFWLPDDRKADLTNKAESIMDLLVDNGILRDDAWQITGQVILIPMGIDKKNPRVEIELSTD